MIDTTVLEQKELEVLSGGVWGTIGPRSVEAAAALADCVGAKYGLLCHSLDAAYESLLRHFGVAHGDLVLTGEVGSPLLSLVAVCVGGAPLFAPVCESCGMVSPDALDAMLGQQPDVRCVVLDFLSENADGYPLDRVSEVCKQHAVPLILQADGSFSARYCGRPLAAYADGVIYSLEQGSEICTGKGGLVATDSETVYAGAYAYHNCGRSFGEGCSLNIDEIVGGDLRVTEWASMAALTILESGDFAAAAPRKLVKMAGQPVFESDYAKKMTGR